MRLSPCVLLVVALGIAQPAFGAALAHSDNFLVVAPDRQAAEVVLSAAELCRKELALEWLGEELPPSVGMTVIHVELSDNSDKGLAWPIDSPERSLHKLWLVGSPEKLVAETLRHEITHVVLATQFPGKLPAWADEGAASLQDDSQRRAIRSRLLAWWAQTGNWPRLEVVFAKPIIPPGDQASYAVAASVTQYLLDRGGRNRFLRFAMEGKAAGYAQALMRHYGIADLAALEAGWQEWVRQDYAPPATAASGVTPRAGALAPTIR